MSSEAPAPFRTYPDAPAFIAASRSSSFADAVSITTRVAGHAVVMSRAARSPPPGIVMSRSTASGRC